MFKKMSFFQKYALLTKRQLQDVFSGHFPLSSTFKVFLGKVFPGFLGDFVRYEKDIKKILKKQQRKRRVKAFRKSLFGN